MKSTAYNKSIQKTNPTSSKFKKINVNIKDNPYMTTKRKRVQTLINDDIKIFC